MSSLMPLELAAPLRKNVLGGLIVELVGVASFSKYFPAPNHMKATFVNNRPYKAELIRMVPHIRRALPVDDLGPPALWFSKFSHVLVSQNHPSATPQMREFVQAGFAGTHLLLSYNMRMYSYPNLTPHARFQVTGEDAEKSHEELIRRGLDPSRFFVCFHAREPGYQFRTGSVHNVRSVDPQRYLAAIRHVTEDLGGQVVRLGDPTMTEFPAMDGLIDLTREPNMLTLHGYSLSRARYAVCSDSGVLPLASAFGTPLVAADVVNPFALPIGEHVALTKTMVTGDGRRLRQEELYRSGMMPGNDVLPEGASLVDCETEELIAAIDVIHERTADCTGLRPLPDEPMHTPMQDGAFFERLLAPNPRFRDDISFLDLP